MHGTMSLKKSHVYLDKCKKLLNNFFLQMSVARVMCYIKLFPILKVFTLLYFYFPKNVRSAQYGCLLHFPDVVLSRYIDRVFSE